MTREYQSIRNESVVSQFDKVQCDQYDEPLRVIFVDYTRDGSKVTAEGLVNSEVVTETFIFPRDKDKANVIRPRNLCFSSKGDERRDHMFRAYVQGYYQGNSNPTVDGYELYEDLAERFRNEF